MNINKIVRILIYSDLSIVTGFSLYVPIFAIFLSEKIEGGGAALAGFAAATYWLTRVLVQLPISKYLDRHDGERDDFWALVVGSLLFSSIPFFYIFASLPWHVFVLQFLYGIGDSLAVPTYLSLYGRHVDKERSSSEWGLRSTVVGVGSAIAGALGGVLATKFGFSLVLALTGALSFVGSFCLIPLRKYMSKDPSRWVEVGEKEAMKKKEAV